MKLFFDTHKYWFSLKVLDIFNSNDICVNTIIRKKLNVNVYTVKKYSLFVSWLVGYFNFKFFWAGFVVNCDFHLNLKLSFGILRQRHLYNKKKTNVFFLKVLTLKTKNIYSVTDCFNFCLYLFGSRNFMFLF